MKQAEEERRPPRDTISLKVKTTENGNSWLEATYILLWGYPFYICLKLQFFIVIGYRIA